MPLSTIFQLYRGSQFYWWRKLEYPETTTDVTNFLFESCLLSIKIGTFLSQAIKEILTFDNDLLDYDIQKYRNTNLTIFFLLTYQ
jgi:hypothetical protein